MLSADFRARRAVLARFPGLEVLAVVGLTALGAGADVTHDQKAVWAPDVYGGYSSSTVSVRFAEGALLPDNGASTGVPAVDVALARWGVTAIDRAYPLPFGNPQLAARIGLDRNYIIHVPDGTDSPTLVKELLAFPQVFDSVTPVGIGGTAEIPNDPLFEQCYGEHNTGQFINGTRHPQSGKPDADVDAPEAWEIFTGDDNVVVALIDSGCNITHEDLVDHMLPGWNTVLNNDYMVDDCPHGTHPAGTIAATAGNGVGVAGLCWKARILPVKVLTGCNGNTTDCAEGIIWAADQGANIETMSLQYYSYDQYHHDSVQYAHGLDVVVIAAAGNNQGKIVAYPAKYENCVAVSATTNRDELGDFSNWGDEVDLSAPGQDVLSTWTDGGYAYDSGTSMATPHVAGSAALIRSYNPGLTADEVTDILLGTTDDLGPAGWDDHFGTGRLNLNSAMLNSTPGVYVNVATPPAVVTPPGAVVSFDVTLRERGDEFVPGSQQLHYRFDGGAYQTRPLIHQQGDIWTATLPAVSCDSAPEFYVSAEGVNLGARTFPKNAPDGGAMFLEVGELQTTYQSVEGFNAGLPDSWSADGLWHVTNTCSPGASCDSGTFAYFGKDFNCLYYNGQNPAAGSLKTMLAVPAVSPAGSVQLVYCSTLVTENHPGFDTAILSVDGVAAGLAHESASWRTETTDITAYAGQNVELAFTFDTKDGSSNNFRGWQVDGVRLAITEVVCAGCFADFTGDGALDLFDFLGYVNAFNAGDLQADCDRDGGLNLFDFLCFVNAFNGGC